MKPKNENPDADSCVPCTPEVEWTDGGLVYASTPNSKTGYKHTANHAPASPTLAPKLKARAPAVAEGQEQSTTDSSGLQEEDLSAQEVYIADSHTPMLGFTNTLPWRSWKEVPEPDALPVNITGGFFLEVFAGTAHLTLAMRAHGVPCLPPVEKSTKAGWFEPSEAFEHLPKIQRWIQAGRIHMLHLGTECKTFSKAHKDDEGPPPIRCPHTLNALPTCTAEERASVELGTRMAEASFDLAESMGKVKKTWTLENPHSSMIWQMKEAQLMLSESKAYFVSFPMCAYGSMSKKNTNILTNWATAKWLTRKCCGKSWRHQHVHLKGQILHPGTNKLTWRTSLAQEYPTQLVQTYAYAASVNVFQAPLDIASSVLCPEGSQFKPSFEMQTNDARKRKLGISYKRDEHRQGEYGRYAISAGRQTKNSRVQPLIATEMEPGKVIEEMLTLKHPLMEKCERFPKEVDENLDMIANNPNRLNKLRLEAIEHWTRRSKQLETTSLNELRKIKDPNLRRLYIREGDTGRTTPFFHCALFREMADAAKASDSKVIDELVEGMYITGDVKRSNVWPAKESEAVLTEAQWDADALKEREDVLKQIHSSTAVPEATQECWDKTLTDVDNGYCQGPFWEESEVTAAVGSNLWVPTPRWPLIQHDKVRAIDAGNVSRVNDLAAITERLELPSTDITITAVRSMLDRLKARNQGSEKLRAWVIDEEHAYRGIGIHPSQKRFAVVAMKDPASGKVAFFLMTGHAFGWSAAVYNFNRRARLKQEILRKLFYLPCWAYYDDLYGLETDETVDNAVAVARKVHELLGILYGEHKVKQGPDVDLLGVAFRLPNLKVGITARGESSYAPSSTKSGIPTSYHQEEPENSRESSTSLGTSCGERLEGP